MAISISYITWGHWQSLRLCQLCNLMPPGSGWERTPVGAGSRSDSELVMSYPRSYTGHIYLKSARFSILLSHSLDAEMNTKALIICGKIICNTDNENILCHTDIKSIISITLGRIWFLLSDNFKNKMPPYNTSPWFLYCNEKTQKKYLVDGLWCRHTMSVCDHQEVKGI